MTASGDRITRVVDEGGLVHLRLSGIERPLPGTPDQHGNWWCFCGTVTGRLAPDAPLTLCVDCVVAEVRDAR